MIIRKKGKIKKEIIEINNNILVILKILLFHKKEIETKNILIGKEKNNKLKEEVFLIKDIKMIEKTMNKKIIENFLKHHNPQILKEVKIILKLNNKKNIITEKKVEIIVKVSKYYIFFIKY